MSKLCRGVYKEAQLFTLQLGEHASSKTVCDIKEVSGQMEELLK